MIQADNLPAALRRNGLFCCWRREQRGERTTKVPYNPRTGGLAQSNNPDTFAPFQEALQAVGHYDGLGVGIFGDLAAIDIDHCIDSAGQWSGMAKDVVETMDCYTEVSPSGNGIRILFTVPKGFPYDTGRYYINNQKAGLEVYVAGVTRKYVSVTGYVLTPCDTLRQRDRQLAQVLERYMVRPAAQAPAPRTKPAPGAGLSLPLEDADLLSRARTARNGEAFSRLWAGDCSGYQSQSEADMALCNQLAFWTGRDPQRMDKLFRQSGLMRDKWDRPQSGTTYGAITIQNACQNCREVYTPRADAPPGRQPPAAGQPKETPPETPPLLSVISARELQEKELAPVRWAVVGMLPAGFHLLASPPKYGKSWLVLDLGLSVAFGLPFLGRETVQGRCLYLALEDSENRLKGRMNKLLAFEHAPAAFDFATKAADLDHGLLEQLEGYVTQHPDTRIIIIDTLQKVRGEAKRTEGAYQTDYREAGKLKAFADRHRLCLLCVHHLRKMADDSDPFNRISGTNGLMGAADTALVLVRKNRNDPNTILSITGRDVEPSDEILVFDKLDCKWQRIGSVDHLAQISQRNEFEEKPLVQTVRKLMEKYPEGWAGTSAELMEEAVTLMGFYPEDNPRAYTTGLGKIKSGLFNYDHIRVEIPENRSNGKRRIRIFRAASSAQSDNGTQAEKFVHCLI